MYMPRMTAATTEATTFRVQMNLVEWSSAQAQQMFPMMVCIQSGMVIVVVAR